jgi:hypothetical protein
VYWEGETGTIELEAANDPIEGDYPYAVELMIACLYTGDYDAAVQEHEETTTKDEDGNLVVDDRESSTVTAAGSIQDGDTMSEFLSFKGKNKKKKWKKRKKVPKNLLWQHRSAPLQAGPPESVLDLHARMFALASKYDIPQLRTVSLTKFQNETQNSWHQVGFIVAIQTAFRTAPEDNSLWNLLEKTIVHKGSQLASDYGFELVVAKIPGLAISLFRQKCHWTDAQRICSNCKRIFLSNCAYEGCVKEAHNCDTNGRCQSCFTRPFGARWS